MPIVTIKELATHLPPGTRLLGVDHGTKKLGLALSSPDLTLTTPLKTLACSNFSEYVKNLAEICREYNVGGFVIGLPFNMDGSEGPRAQSVRHFADNLFKAKDRLGMEPLIAFWDERLSSFAAEQTLIDDFDMPRKKRGDVIDQMAAVYILKGALDAVKS